ncbi:MAG: aminopeptidase [Nevskia sp.]
MIRAPRPDLLRLALGAGLLALAGCSSGLGYYAHLARGQMQLLARRTPIARLVADPATDERLRTRLALALEARAFASAHLALPDNGSYTLYADLGRPWVVQNVFATPEFSTGAIEHCFPIAGCVGYRGYYDRTLAEAEAARLKAAGDDVYIGNSPAYSTLGWFDDPVLNTMLRRDDDELAGTIFHELGHQRLYVQNDTTFNESFATFIEQQGLREWRAARGQPATDAVGARRADRFAELVLATRTRLETLYASGRPPAEMRALKQAEFERLRRDYRALREREWQGYSGYDAWIDAEINNAKLLPFGLYHRWIPAFAALFEQAGRNWPAFYASAKQLADAPAATRGPMLERLESAAHPGIVNPA